MENLRSKNKLVLDAREQEIKQITHDLHKINDVFEKQQKEMKVLKAENNKLTVALRENTSKEEERTAEAEAKIVELEDKILRLDQDTSDKIRNLTRERESLESTNQYLTATTDLKKLL